MNPLLSRSVTGLVWLAALAFALVVALPVYLIAGFGMGPVTAGEKIWNATLALGAGIVSQAGLAAAPVVRSRGRWPRFITLILMVPSFLFGLLAYRDFLRRLSDPGVQPFETLAYVYLAIAPVYALVAVWMWRAPQAPPAD